MERDSFDGPSPAGRGPTCAITGAMTQGALSIVLPCLNAADGLPSTFAALDEARSLGLLHEVLVVDGGSRDGTAALAAGLGARVIESAPGRGRQLAKGGEAARGDWLFFLHADSRPEPGWSETVRAFIADPANCERAAVFRLRLDDSDPRARRVERLAGWRARRLGLPYGDQGLLMAGAFYRRLGGYRPLELMEDVDLVRRIGRRRICLLDHMVVTSARRYRQDGWWARPLRNLALLFGYFLGLPTGLLRRLYG